MQIKGTAKEVGWALWGIFDTQQGGFGAKISRHFFPFSSERGSLPLPPLPKTREFLVVRRSVSASADASGNVF